MTKNNSDEYYRTTAQAYDGMQIIAGDEHSIALSYLDGIVLSNPEVSILDVGCGTGRALEHIRSGFPSTRLHGVERSEAMLTVCREKEIPNVRLDVGNAKKLPYPDESFDIVTAFGVLHHIDDPGDAIDEMIRVSRNAIFISDHNVYGWGGKVSRSLKNLFRILKLWKMFVFLHTRGKGFYDTSYDGIFFPFSILDHSNRFSEAFHSVNFLTTKSYGPALYASSSHMAVYAHRKRT